MGVTRRMCESKDAWKRPENPESARARYALTGSASRATIAA